MGTEIVGIMKMSALEEAVGIRWNELTKEELEAIHRIKTAYTHLSYREKQGSPTDVITDLGVAIAAELRRARKDEVNVALDIIDELVKK